MKKKGFLTLRENCKCNLLFFKDLSGFMLQKLQILARKKPRNYKILAQKLNGSFEEVLYLCPKI